MRGLLTGILAALILLTLAACGSEKTDAGNDGKEEDSATVNGVVNCMGDFLVLLTDDGGRPDEERGLSPRKKRPPRSPGAGAFHSVGHLSKDGFTK